MKLCKVEGCCNPVWGKGYCKYHQYLRTDISTPKKTQKTIRKLSIKRKALNDIYLSLKKESVLNAKKKGPIKCFFCNKIIKGEPDWHHLEGREENKLTDTSRLVFVHRKCHGKIHDLSYEMLSRLPCYESYLMRLKTVDELLYFKEYEKRNK